jgi:5-methylcytosine-specific restriction endonuclease McrA
MLLYEDGKRLRTRDLLINVITKIKGHDCGICGKELTDRYDVEIDHIVNLRLNGSNDMENLQLAHKSCHRSKDIAVKLQYPIAHKKILLPMDRKKYALPSFRREALQTVRLNIIFYINQGVSKTEIAKKLGMSRPTLYDILNRIDV